jgi:hypothetical protein
MTLADIGGHAELEGLLVCLLIVGLVSAAIWLAGRALGRPDIGNPAALIVFIVGAVLCLL